MSPYIGRLLLAIGFLFPFAQSSSAGGDPVKPKLDLHGDPLPPDAWNPRSWKSFGPIWPGPMPPRRTGPSGPWWPRPSKACPS